MEYLVLTLFCLLLFLLFGMLTALWRSSGCTIICCAG